MAHVLAFPGNKGEAASLPALATYCRNVFGAIFNTGAVYYLKKSVLRK
jgi:hypothetical protein